MKQENSKPPDDPGTVHDAKARITRTLKLSFWTASIEGREAVVLRILVALCVLVLVAVIALVTMPFGRAWLRSILGNEGSVAILLGPQQQSVSFKKTFLFWVPRYEGVGDSSTQHSNNRYDELHAWLINRCGGYSRWEVKGGRYFTGRGNIGEDGYFYQSSVSTDRPEISKEELYHQISTLFRREDLYIIEITHAK